MGLLSLGVGMAVGYVIGTKTGQSGLEKARRSASDLWNTPEVQDKVQGAVSTASDNAARLAQDVAEKTVRTATAAADILKQGAAEVSEIFEDEYHAPETAPASHGDVVTDPGLSTEKEGSDWAQEGGYPGSRDDASN